MKNGKKVNSRPRNLDMELYDGIHKAIIKIIRKLPTIFNTLFKANPPVQ